MTRSMADTEAYWMGGRLIKISYVSEEAAAPSFTESLLRPGQGPALNVHRYVDFAHYVVEGSLTFSVDGVLTTVGAGDVIVVPRGTPSTYLVGPDGARVLNVTTPGHPWVNYVRALGVPATDLTLPPASFVALPMETVYRLAKANGLEFVGERLEGASREGS